MLGATALPSVPQPPYLPTFYVHVLVLVQKYILTKELDQKGREWPTYRKKISSGDDLKLKL